MKYLLIAMLFFIPGYAYAQSTATQAIVVLPTTVGCPGSLPSCVVPISTTNPMPVQ